MAGPLTSQRAEERELRILRLRQRWLERVADKLRVGHVWGCLLLLNLALWLILAAIAKGLWGATP